MTAANILKATQEARDVSAVANDPLAADTPYQPYYIGAPAAPVTT